MTPSIQHQLDQFVPRTKLGTQVREIVGKHYPNRTCAVITITEPDKLYGFEIMLTTRVKLKFLFFDKKDGISNNLEETSAQLTRFERFFQIERIIFPQSYDYPQKNIIFQGLFPAEKDLPDFQPDVHLLEHLIIHQECFAQ